MKQAQSRQAASRYHQHQPSRLSNRGCRGSGQGNVYPPLLSGLRCLRWRFRRRHFSAGLGLTVALLLSLGELVHPAESPLSSPQPLQRYLAPSNSFLPSLLGLDDQLWGSATAVGSRQSLLQAIDYSLRYLNTSEAEAAYANYPVQAFTRDRVQRSLERFRQLLLESDSAAELREAVFQEFELYQSIGSDNQGTVHFTGYFQPVYAASRTPTAEFRYPLYRQPPNLAQWSLPHPTRLQLEGQDGLQGDRGQLRGLELVWLRDRLEAYLVQVQGSAQLQLSDGSTLAVGYDGRTDYPYVSLGRELVKDGKIPEAELNLPRVIQYFQTHPTELNRYIPRNNRFIFFKETTGSPAVGSLNVPVTSERSIATDKSLMPPGALALIQTEIPDPTGANSTGADSTGADSASTDSTSTDSATLTPRWVSRYVLDQDTGGAIRGAGRVDIFMGSGKAAGDRAGLINHTGQLYYLLLRE
ncbi:MAG TPA: murein transglycosylase A [Allocoleopsis sp.]